MCDVDRGQSGCSASNGGNPTPRQSTPPSRPILQAQLKQASISTPKTAASLMNRVLRGMCTLQASQLQDQVDAGAESHFLSVCLGLVQLSWDAQSPLLALGSRRLSFSATLAIPQLQSPFGVIQDAGCWSGSSFNNCFTKGLEKDRKTRQNQLRNFSTKGLESRHRGRDRGRLLISVLSKQQGSFAEACQAALVSRSTAQPRALGSSPHHNIIGQGPLAQSPQGMQRGSAKSLTHSHKLKQWLPFLPFSTALVPPPHPFSNHIDLETSPPRSRSLSAGG
ncbi:hypothetical protein B0T21DRAFT_144617 [Apiosordaria backusii]|uniref:Uncharacterized protein n=1 Tax=Apiosordaria backusii TaxID=314023 RepID=A0AA40EIS0_9PEZI|nr:hypothetical protein B0T21DRAFT_144617 [Apiosordaria backusii]